MSHRNFGQFLQGGTPQDGDHVVGYSAATPGGERRWTFSSVWNYISLKINGTWRGIAVEGQTTLTPGSTADTLTLAAGAGIALETNNTTKTATVVNTDALPDRTDNDGAFLTLVNGALAWVRDIAGKILIRSGTEATLASTVLDGTSTASELAWDKTLKTIRAGDGEVVGGETIAGFFPKTIVEEEDGERIEPIGSARIEVFSDYYEPDDFSRLGFIFKPFGFGATPLWWPGLWWDDRETSWVLKGGSGSDLLTGKIELRPPQGEAKAVFDFGNITQDASFALQGGDAFGALRSSTLRRLDSSVNRTTTTLSSAHAVGIGISILSFRLRAKLHFTADATGGIKLSLVAGSGLVLSSALLRVTAENLAGTRIFTTTVTALGQEFGGAGETEYIVDIDGIFTVSTTGSMALHFAQQVANGTSTLLANSYTEITPL